MKRNKTLAVAAILFFCIFNVENIFGQIASGGAFTLEQKVVAGGGGESVDSSGVIIQIEGTLGQKAAGTLMSGGGFSQYGGFWTPMLIPTAANASISGRVIAGKNTGVKDVTVTLSGGMLTAPQVVRTNNFGYFKFENVEVGYFYVLRVRHKNLDFENDTQVFTLNDNLEEIVFQAIMN